MTSLIRSPERPGATVPNQRDLRIQQATRPCVLVLQIQRAFGYCGASFHVLYLCIQLVARHVGSTRPRRIFGPICMTQCDDLSKRNSSTLHTLRLRQLNVATSLALYVMSDDASLVHEHAPAILYIGHPGIVADDARGRKLSPQKHA